MQLRGHSWFGNVQLGLLPKQLHCFLNGHLTTASRLHVTTPRCEPLTKARVALTQTLRHLLCPSKVDQGRRSQPVRL